MMRQFGKTTQMLQWAVSRLAEGQSVFYATYDPSRVVNFFRQEVIGV